MLLGQCRVVLIDEHSIEFHNLLDEDDVPDHSHVVLMLSQYVAAMDQFKSLYFGYDTVVGYIWSID